MQKTAVLLDPHPLWLDAVQFVLHSLDVKVVGKTCTADEALMMIEEHEPDVLLIEPALAGGTAGTALIRNARQRVPSLRVIALAASADPADIDAAFDAGAQAYVLKTARPDDVAATVRQAFDPSIFLTRARPVAVAAGQLERAGADEPTPSLTRREREILALVAEGHPNRELARMLWVTEQTVKFHLSNIYRKLEVSNRTEASRWAHKHQLLNSVDTAPEAIPA